MTAAADLERVTAKAFGSTRTARIGARVALADVAAFVAGGVTYQPECKRRKRLPRLLVDALDQARRYSPDATPIAVLREHGDRALAVVELTVLCRLLGIAPDVMPTKHKPTPRDPKQMEMFS